VTWDHGTRREAEKKYTNINLSQERICHLHAVCAASPRPRYPSLVLRSVHFLVICRHVWWIEYENVDRVFEAACQWTRE